MNSRLIYHGPDRVGANQLFRAVLEVVPARRIVPGGRVVVATRHVSDFSDPQTDDPGAENYVAVEPGGTQRWQLGDPMMWDRFPWNRGIDLELVGDEIAPGEVVRIHLGPQDAGCPGYRCQSFAESHFGFRLGIDPDGSGDWEVMPEAECPGFRIVGARVVDVRVVVPSTRPGRSVCVRLKPEDRHGNVAGEGAGEVTLLLDDRAAVGSAALGAGRPAAAGVRVPDDGKWHWVTAASDDGSFWSRSNPIGPSPVEGMHLLWGEIHTQSRLCDGTDSPAELYEYAREAAGLDFASVTSHDLGLTQRDWEEIKEATREANRPGEFVTFLGYEWSGPCERGGDNNVYFLGDDGPLLYSGPWEGPPAWDAAAGEVDRTRTLSEVCDALRGTDALIIPHCGGRLCNFDFYDRELMPLFEIHSCHRNYEHVAFEAIRRGLRFGFIGGSDDHRGAVGDSHPAARERFFSAHNGLVAVYSTGLTREALWEAFFARRVYATNGPRIVLDFRINGVPMGGELRVEEGEPLHIKCWARLDGLMDRMELVRGTATVRRFVSIENQVCEFTAEHEETARPGATAYYFRVYQVDGGTAWSSPIWVDAE